MSKDLNILDLFSGIGGFPLGFEKAGYKIKNHYFSEIDNYRDSRITGLSTDYLTSK